MANGDSITFVAVAIIGLHSCAHSAFTEKNYIPTVSVPGSKPLRASIYQSY